MSRLITKAQWLTFNPWAQGYVLYMQAKHPDSELKDIKNPYIKGTYEYFQFINGENSAVQEAQDHP